MLNVYSTRREPDSEIVFSKKNLINIQYKIILFLFFKNMQKVIFCTKVEQIYFQYLHTFFCLCPCAFYIYTTKKYTTPSSPSYCKLSHSCHGAFSRPGFTTKIRNFTMCTKEGYYNAGKCFRNLKGQSHEREKMGQN